MILRTNQEWNLYILLKKLGITSDRVVIGKEGTFMSQKESL